MSALLWMSFTAALQSAAYTLITRARAGKSILFHAFAATVTAIIWLWVIRQVVASFDSTPLMGAYVVGSVAGSVGMHHLMLRAGRWLSPVVASSSIGGVPCPRCEGFGKLFAGYVGQPKRRVFLRCQFCGGKRRVGRNYAERNQP